MVHRILVFCATYVVFAATGCADNQSVITALPDPSVRPGPVRAPVAPHVPSPLLVGPPYRPYATFWHAAARLAAYGEPGWTPAAGISDRPYSFSFLSSALSEQSKLYLSCPMEPPALVFAARLYDLAYTMRHSGSSEREVKWEERTGKHTCIRPHPVQPGGSSA